MSDSSEAARLAALHAYGILDSAPEASFDRLARLAATICAMPIATVTLVDRDRQWFKAQVGLGVCETPRSVAFCDHTIRSPQLHVVEDAHHDARFATNPLVVGPPFIRFYAGAPLVTPDGHILGALCVMDHVPRELDEAQREVLALLAEQASLQLEARVSGTRLRDALEASHRATERLTTTLESFTDAFFTVDRDWRFTYVNGEAERVLLRKREELLGRNVWDEFPEAVDSEVYPAYHRAVASGQAEHLEFFFPPLQTWFEVHAYPSSEGLAVYFRDITARKSDEAAMATLRAELERSNAELRQFAFVASHDLREPLRKVRVFADRLLTHWERIDAAGREDHLRRMSESAERMDRLLDALLGYSRVTTRPPAHEELSLADVVAEVLQDLELRMQACGGRVVLADDLPAVQGDREQIRQVFLNLFANATKFRHPERALRIDVRATHDRADRVRVEVADNGSGFEPAHAQRLFEPYARLSVEVSEGSGMGLAIVRSVVVRHGGEIRAEGRPGEGACFMFDLPAAPS